MGFYKVLDPLLKLSRIVYHFRREGTSLESSPRKIDVSKSYSSTKVETPHTFDLDGRHCLQMEVETLFVFELPNR